MEAKDNIAKGGVLLIHQIHNGKHQYEVDDVVKFKKEKGGGSFASKGDTLIQLNEINLEDVPPEMLAQMLTNTMRNPMLTVHKNSQIKQPSPSVGPDEGALQPFSKETTMLSFSLEMSREDGEKVGEGRENIEEECPLDKGKKFKEGGVLIVSLTNTNISVVKRRGCQMGSQCSCCVGSGCTLNDVIVMANSATVTLVPRGFTQQKQKASLGIENVFSSNYLKSFCLQNKPYASPNPEKITIYYYKSTSILNFNNRGMAVVLNFTDSNCFLQCNKEGGRPVLKVQTFEKQRLQKISESDEEAMSFLFYMKATMDKFRKFESVLCRGWFIKIVNSDTVQMDTKQGQDPSFYFVIRT